MTLLRSLKVTASPGIPASCSARSSVADPACTPPVQYVCEHCNRDFRTKGGLGVHTVRAHPEVANRKVDVERVKARWSEEEVRMMAREEALLLSKNPPGEVRINVNRELTEIFPQRTLEAIKGRRRREDYQRLVREFRQQVASEVADREATDDGPGADEAMTSRQAVGIPTESPNSSHPSVPPQNAERLRSAISELSVVCARFRSFGVDELLNVANAALTGEVDLQAIERWLTGIFPPRPAANPPRRRETKPTNPQSNGESRKQRRVREFGCIQTLYKKSLKACLQRILDGDSERTRPSDVEFCDYWAPVLQARSAADGDMTALRESLGGRRKAASTGQSLPADCPSGSSSEGAAVSLEGAVDKSTLWGPVTVTEVARITVRTGTAPGLDGIVPRMWNAVPIPIRALLFNLLLLARRVPGTLAVSRTVFLEKSGMPPQPAAGDYRPLSIGSVVLRHFHKILAHRLSTLGVIDERQRGFRRVDGVCENVTALSAMLVDARQRCRSIHVACVDLSKAFDTVSHKAILNTLVDVGLPQEFHEYVSRLYDDATTLLRKGSEMFEVLLGRGVRQGDPLSPLLFNLVVDRALGLLSEDVGYKMGDRWIGALAYADDIVLLSSTTAGMQLNLDRLEIAFRQCGLTINPKKTGVLSLVASGREKKVKILERPTFKVGGALVPQRSLHDVWQYLGATYEGARVKVANPPLCNAIEHLGRAPLKPQQRLRLLRDCLIPRYLHQWLVGSVTAKVLRRADIVVRASVRRWLRLPNDVPVGYFHAPIQSGGLGIPALRTLIPVLKYRRLQSLQKSTLPAACAAVESTYVARQLVWCESQMRVSGNRVASGFELRRQWTECLYKSCDGRGLREVGSSKLNSSWVSDYAGSVPGADYVHYHHIRANCIPSRARCARGRPELAVRCRAGCLETETPAHCIQRCVRTHGGRILRHDDLCRQVAGFLTQKGWHVEAEKSYSTSAGRKRPDLVIAKGGEAVVVDAQVVSGEEGLNVTHRRKVEKYSSIPDLSRRVAEHVGVPCNNVRFTALTISWRGVWSPDSVNELRQLGLTMGQLRSLTTRTLWGSWLNWRRFNETTSRWGYGRRAVARRGGAVVFDPGGVA